MDIGEIVKRAFKSDSDRRVQQFLKAGVSRRSFMNYALGSLAGIVGSSWWLNEAGHREMIPTASAAPRVLPAMPPLFCVAYIDPTVEGHQGQEGVVARYPLTLVPQDGKAAHVRWRDRIKELNPSIVMLGYQMVIEETTVPGPGHDKQRALTDAWSVYPGGFVPTVQAGPGKFRRIFDPRKKEWRENFVEACRATLASYPFDGLFLDQCTVFGRAHPSEGGRAEMRQALQDAIAMVRKEFPSHLLVGNSSYHWRGLNGEMNESRVDAMNELNPFEGHAAPRMQLFHTTLKHAHDVAVLRKQMEQALARGAFYGASVDYQHVLWFEEFDEVVADFRRAAKKPA